jgi:hypothetical protein
MNNRSQKERPYLLMTLGTLVLAGGGLIALIYGPASLLTSLPFLLFGAVLILLLWWLVSAVSGWRERSEEEYHEAAAKHIARIEAERNAKGKHERDNPGSR